VADREAAFCFSSLSRRDFSDGDSSLPPDSSLLSSLSLDGEKERGASVVGRARLAGRPAVFAAKARRITFPEFFIFNLSRFSKNKWSNQNFATALGVPAAVGHDVRGAANGLQYWPMGSELLGPPAARSLALLPTAVGPWCRGQGGRRQEPAYVRG
jgi:hypothetical protein